MRKPRTLLRSVRARALPIAVAVLAATATAALAANISGDGTLVGTTGNDNITAGNGNDTVWGLGGSDNIKAGHGNDVIDGGGACPAGLKSGDYPNGLPSTSYCQHGPHGTCGADNISIAAGSGNDTVWGNCGPNNISIGAGQGNDTVYGYGGPNNITVGSGDDTIYLYDTSGASNLTTGVGEKNGGGGTIYAQSGQADQITCDGKNSYVVYASHKDTVKGCQTVKFTSPARDARNRASTKRTGKRTANRRHAHRRNARSSHAR